MLSTIICAQLVPMTLSTEIITPSSYILLSPLLPPLYQQLFEKGLDKEVITPSSWRRNEVQCEKLKTGGSMRDRQLGAKMSALMW